MTKNDLVKCVRDMYSAGLTTSVSGNQSVRTGQDMWITPSGIPRYKMRASDLVRVAVGTGQVKGKGKPSREEGMHRRIYLESRGIRSIVHTHSPFTLAVASASEFIHIIEEAKIIVGKPTVIDNRPSGSSALADAVAAEFAAGARAVVVRNHGVIAGAENIHIARAIIEALEEWSKVLVLSNVLGGPKHLLRD